MVNYERGKIIKYPKEMNYNIDIKTSGYLTAENVNTDTKLKVTQSQLDILLKFADVRRDSELKEIYKINECEFTVTLSLDEPKKDWIDKESWDMFHRMNNRNIYSMCGDAPKVNVFYDIS